MQIVCHYWLNIRKVWKLLNLILSILRVLIILKWSNFVTICQLDIVNLRILFFYYLFCYFYLIYNFVFIMPYIINFLILFIRVLLIFIIFCYILQIIFIFLINLFNKIWNLTRKTLKILLWIKDLIFDFIRCLFLTILLNLTASMHETLVVWIFNILTWPLSYFISMQDIREMRIAASVT